jgi:hypothetical protein
VVDSAAAMVAEADLVADSEDLVAAMVEVVDLVEALAAVDSAAVDSAAVDSAAVDSAVDSDSAVKVRCNRLWYKSPIQRHKSWIPYLSGTYNNRHLMYS